MGGERGYVRLRPLEEGEESGRTRRESGGGENGVDNGRSEVREVGLKRGFGYRFGGRGEESGDCLN